MRLRRAFPIGILGLLGLAIWGTACRAPRQPATPEECIEIGSSHEGAIPELEVRQKEVCKSLEISGDVACGIDRWITVRGEGFSRAFVLQRHALGKWVAHGNRWIQLAEFEPTCGKHLSPKQAAGTMALDMTPDATALNQEDLAAQTMPPSAHALPPPEPACAPRPICGLALWSEALMSDEERRRMERIRCARQSMIADIFKSRSGSAEEEQRMERAIHDLFRERRKRR